MNDTVDNFHPMIARVSDKQQLSAWLVRYFFSEKKKHNTWWSADINEGNVLAYVSRPDSNFPLSPKDICDDWFLKKSLSNTDMTDFDYEIEQPKAKKVKKEAVYNTGLHSLKDIGKQLHGVTAMMAFKIETVATGKLQTLAGTTDYLTGLSSSVDLISEAEDYMSKEYARLLSTVKTKEAFLALIKKNYQITNFEMLDLSSPRELDMLDYLLKQDSTSVAQYLRGDILKNDNRMKSFQTLLSRYLYPGNRRGRPRKPGEPHN